MKKINKKPRVLIYDIETAPNLSYTWGKWQQDVIEFEKEWEMLCFSYRWYGERKTMSESLHGCKTEKELVTRLWKLFDEADVLITHNGDAFDNKKSNAKFLEYGLTPPAGYQSVDTCKAARRYFKFNSNKLNDLAKILKIGKKAQTGGFALWKGCMAGDSKSWKTMVRYCEQDVLLTEKVYLALRPWMKNHPNYNLFAGTTHNCDKCSSALVQKRGFHYTRAGKYQRYQCKSCGGWSVGEKIKHDKVLK